MSDFRLAIGRASGSFVTFVRLLKQERPPQRAIHVAADRFLILTKL